MPGADDAGAPAELEEQRRDLEAAFVGGLVSRDARRESRGLITGVTDDLEVIITGAGEDARVTLLFSHERRPGRRFGHRFPAPEWADGYEEIWLKEEIETGALGRQMRQDPRPDEAGIIWTAWGDPLPDHEDARLR